ncbi:selenoprotein B, glycine/betaine/sarcosine/D- proline reductase family [Aminobacterium colombiense DSM 12261]|uniref:Selenoprotein B, glycine/betaine/sarcosine/D-proline reductase family n=2 Tax=Aminobacterium TaxID=81466 RepID=D5EG29_AMICL|nr:selenoprotein B, glycine/betaine/sarcosine/D- proline reductase family [Aminobacterium colombiense DSM 12261]
MTYRVVHYINQFFAGIGGEEKADYQPELREGVVGPGMALNAAFKGEAEVIATVICGDTYFASNMEEATKTILDMVKQCNADAFVAGPAFNAGRYGTACGAICSAVSKELGIPVVSAMYQENPGVEMYKKNLYIVEAADSARGMGKAVPAMTALLLKQLRGEKIGLPAEEGYHERGVRVNKFYEKLAAERAVDMFVAKLQGEPFTTEYPMPVFDRVAPQPAVKDLKNATIALVTSGGICPKGNPDHIEASSASKYGEYDITGVDDLTADEYCTAHGGYDATYADQDADRVLPVDVLREMEKAGVFKKLHNKFYTTVGNGTAVASAKRFGAEIAEKLKKDGVDAVILTST